MDDSTTIEFRDSAAPLGETLRQLARSIEGERVTVRELLSMVGEQGLLLALMFLTVPFLLPISIPGVSTVFGAVAILISLGITFNRVPWLPDRLLDRPLDAVKLTAAIEKGADRFGRVDRISHPRLQRLTDSKAMNRLAGLGLLLCSSSRWGWCPSAIRCRPGAFCCWPPGSCSATGCSSCWAISSCWARWSTSPRWGSGY